METATAKKEETKQQKCILVFPVDPKGCTEWKRPTSLDLCHCRTTDLSSKVSSDDAKATIDLNLKILINLRY